MTKQDIINKLENCKKLELEIMNIEQQLDRIERRRAAACDKSDANCNTDTCDSKCCKIYCKSVAHLKELLSERLCRSAEAVLQCREMIELLCDSTQTRLLYLHYIEGQSWQQVCDTVHYSLSFCMKQRRKAIDTLHKILSSC